MCTLRLKLLRDLGIQFSDYKSQLIFIFRLQNLIYLNSLTTKPNLPQVLNYKTQLTQLKIQHHTKIQTSYKNSLHIKKLGQYAHIAPFQHSIVALRSPSVVRSEAQTVR